MAGIGGGPPCIEDPLIVFYTPIGLYLRPISKITIIVQLPQFGHKDILISNVSLHLYCKATMKVAGQSISNWDLMEKLKKSIYPIQLEAIRVMESSLEMVSFEAELNSRLNMHRVIKALDGLCLKVAGFISHLKVRAKECEPDFPSRVDWDRHHMRIGGSPDTVHLSMLPAKWFQESVSNGPSEDKLLLAMESFGEVKRVDIPIADPLRADMREDISGLSRKAFSFGQELLCEAYVQYHNYAGFVNAMEHLRNKKWIKRGEGGKIFYANVKVDFDRNCHMKDEKIEEREVERRKLLQVKFEQQEEEERKKREEENARLENERMKERKKQEKELKRKLKYELEHRRMEKRKLLEQRLAEEEKIWAERNEEGAQRLLNYVFNRIQNREDLRKKEEEEKLIEEFASYSGRSQVNHGNEEELRKNLLKQREIAMRERLKAKLAPVKKERRKRRSSSSSRDTYDDGKHKKSKSQKHKKKKKKEKKKKRKSHSK